MMEKSSSFCRSRPDMLRWILIIASLLFLAGPTISAAADRKVRVLAEFEVAPDGDFVLLPLVINRREYPFLVCTGLSTTVIDQSLREELDLPAVESKNVGSRGKERFKLE